MADKDLAFLARPVVPALQQREMIGHFASLGPASLNRREGLDYSCFEGLRL